MILKEGLYLGLTFWELSISACSLSRMLFAMAVPSIFMAVIVNGVLEKALLCGVQSGEIWEHKKFVDRPPRKSLADKAGRFVHEASIWDLSLIFLNTFKMNSSRWDHGNISVAWQKKPNGLLQKWEFTSQQRNYLRTEAD